MCLFSFEAYLDYGTTRCIVELSVLVDDTHGYVVFQKSQCHGEACRTGTNLQGQ